MYKSQDSHCSLLSKATAAQWSVPVLDTRFSTEMHKHPEQSISIAMYVVKCAPKTWGENPR